MNIKSLKFKIGASVVFLILFIEAILLVSSYLSRDNTIRRAQNDLVSKIEKSFKIDIPEDFGAEIIDGELYRFFRNASLMVVLITIVVTTGVVFIFKKIVFVPLFKIIRANEKTDPCNWHKLSAEEMPNDEFGKLMRSRNNMIEFLHSKTDQLMKEKQLISVNQAISIYNHEINNPLTILYGLIQTFTPNDEKQKESLKKMEENMERILKASEDLNKLDKSLLSGEIATGDLSLDHISKKS